MDALDVAFWVLEAALLITHLSIVYIIFQTEGESEEERNVLDPANKSEPQTCKNRGG